MTNKEYFDLIMHISIGTRIPWSTNVTAESAYLRGKHGNAVDSEIITVMDQVLRE